MIFTGLYNWLARKGWIETNAATIHTTLTARKKALGADGLYHYTGDDRVVHDKLITTAFVDFIVDQLQAESAEFGDFKYHQCGLGTVNENITDTGIGTDTGITPKAGSQTETDHDTYKSVATMTMDDTEEITEHVIMSQSGAGTCMDRTEFGVISVVSGNQIEFTFEISMTAGS